MKRAFFITLGCVWIGFGLLLLLFTFEFLSGGAGVQATPNLWLFDFVSSIGLTLGWVHVMGFLIASLICCCIGVGLWAYTPQPAVVAELSGRDALD